MSLEFSAATFFAFLLALARASAWLAFVPPFSTGAIPPVVRLGFASALALAVELAVRQPRRACLPRAASIATSAPPASSRTSSCRWQPAPHSAISLRCCCPT